MVDTRTRLNKLSIKPDAPSVPDVPQKKAA
jgi:hypothetical protein